jgi:Na+/proline symporter
MSDILIIYIIVNFFIIFFSGLILSNFLEDIEKNGIQIKHILFVILFPLATILILFLIGMCFLIDFVIKLCKPTLNKSIYKFKSKQN